MTEEENNKEHRFAKKLILFLNVNYEEKTTSTSFAAQIINFAAFLRTYKTETEKDKRPPVNSTPPSSLTPHSASNE